MVAYKHEGEEFMFVIDGHVEVKVGEDIHELKKGTNLHFDSGKAHHLRNLSQNVQASRCCLYSLNDFSSIVGFL